MKLDFIGSYSKEELKFITKTVNTLELPENDEYLYVGEVTFVATKKEDVVIINKIKNVL